MLTRFVPRAFVVALCAAMASCRISTDAVPHELVGTWETARESTPPGSYQITLMFGRNGRYSNEGRSYGMYPGQAPNDLSGYSRVDGTYEVHGDTVVTHAEERVWWDRFYGADSPEHREAYDSAPFSPSQFEITGSMLVLRYMSYPADAPVPTTMILVRAH